jgi:hypothetical protein
MSNRPKIKKLAQRISMDEIFRQHIAETQVMLAEMLEKCSPGAHFKANLAKEGEFLVYTPSRKLDLKSISTLGMLMDNLTVVGEQALIKAIERANKLVPISEKIQEVLPHEQRMNPDEFITALKAGLAGDLRLFVDVLMDLPDPEGAVIGLLTSMMLLDYLRPFKANLSADSDMAPMKLNIPGETYTIGSPTIFCYVLKHIALKNVEDLKAALSITNFIVALPLFPEFQGRGIPIFEN